MFIMVKNANPLQPLAVLKEQKGFTLIEVLIALVLLAGGLLGLAALQAKGLSNNQSAYNRSQATQLSYDIADRMRANSSAAAKYLTTFMVPSAANAAANACSSTTNTCSPAQLAEKDLDDWSDDLAASLPYGTGSITVASDVYTVTVRWDDDKSGTVDTNDPNFTMRFQL
jgi:type IV pilus assembly protein PilV